MDDGYTGCFLTPCEIPFVLTLGQSCDTFRSWQSIDKGLYFLIFKGGAETVEYDGIGCRVDKLILFGVGGVKEERIFYLSVVVGDVFFDDGVLEGGRPLFYFQTIVHFVTY